MVSKKKAKKGKTTPDTKETKKEKSKTTKKKDEANRTSSSSLLRCLQNCAAALPEGSFESSSIPSSLFCFKFGEGKVSAFDDEIFISSPTPADIDLSAGVNGKVLLALLQHLPNKPVHLRVEKQEDDGLIESNMLQIKCANSRVKIPTIPLEYFPNFKEKESKNSASFVFKEEQIKEFCRAVSNVLSSVEKNSVESLFRGIWILLGDTRWEVYSSNGHSVSRHYLDDVPECLTKKGVVDKIFIPFSLQQAFMSYLRGKDTQEMFLKVDSSWVRLEVDGLSFDGRQIESSKRVDGFAGMFEKQGADKSKEAFVKIPEDLESMLKLSVLFAESRGQKKMVSFDIGDGSMRMMAGGAAGEVEHSNILFEGHPTKEVNFDPDLFLSAISKCSEVKFLDKVAVMNGVNYTYMFSLMAQEDS